MAPEQDVKYGVPDQPLWRKKDEENEGKKDTEEEKDLLDMGIYLQSLKEFIEECPTPMCIALQGGWGTGKTSMINYLRNCLEEDKGEGKGKYRTCYFNTWQYSQFDMEQSLYFSLLSSILRELTGGEGEMWDKIRKSFLPILKAVLEIFTRAPSKRVDEISNVWFEQMENIKKMKKKFQNAINDILGELQQDRAIIFVDDLDRLQPDVAVELLEVMKLFMDVEGCVFVLAVDYDVVVQGVQKKYGENLSSSKCRNFFDKMVQLPFRMPVESYNLEKIFQEYFPNQKKYFKPLSSLIQDTIGQNPRSFKRLLNVYKLNEMVAKRKGLLSEPNNLAALFCCLCIQIGSMEAYELLLRDEFWIDKPNSVECDWESMGSELESYNEEMDSDAFKKAQKILSDIPDIILEIEQKDMGKFRNILQFSCLTKDSSSNIREKFQKITHIVLNEQGYHVNTATEAITETYKHYLEAGTSDEHLKQLEQLNVITDDSTKNTSVFRVTKPLEINGNTFYLGTSTGFQTKTRQAQRLSDVLKLPTRSIQWYDGDELVFENEGTEA